MIPNLGSGPSFLPKTTLGGSSDGLSSWVPATPTAGLDWVLGSQKQGLGCLGIRGVNQWKSTQMLSQLSLKAETCKAPRPWTSNLNSGDKPQSPLPALFLLKNLSWFPDTSGQKPILQFVLSLPFLPLLLQFSYWKLQVTGCPGAHQITYYFLDAPCTPVGGQVPVFSSFWTSPSSSSLRGSSQLPPSLQSIPWCPQLGLGESYLLSASLMLNLLRFLAFVFMH